MKKFLSNNNWWFYFILTYLISWPIWVLGKVLLPENLAIRILITLIIIIAFSSCHDKTVEQVLNEDKEIQLVKQTMDNIFGWAVDKDFDLFYGSIVNDSGFISVTPYERVKFGFNEVRNDSGFWGSPHFKAIRHELRDLHINFSQNKDVAWFFCYLDDINEWKGQPANWENARWTGVLEKRNGRWIIVQQHFSFASE